MKVSEVYIIALILSTVLMLVALVGILFLISKGVAIPSELWDILKVSGAFIAGLHLPSPINQNGKGS